MKTEEKEVWKYIEGQREGYMVSNHGRVKSLITNIYKKQWHTSHGYHRVDIRHEKYYVHRLVAEAFIPNPENKPEVNHKNGIKTCNYPWNLEWCTHKENIRHAVETGLVQTGEDVVNSILTNAQILEMVSLKGKLTVIEISDKFNVQERYVRSVFLGQTWSVVTGIKKYKPRFGQLKPNQVREILFLNKFLPQKEIANKYGKSIGTISHILNGKTWNHITGIKKAS